MPHRKGPTLSDVDRRELRLLKQLLRGGLVSVPTPEEAKEWLDNHRLSSKARGGAASLIEQQAVDLWRVCAADKNLRELLQHEHSVVYEAQLSALRGVLQRLCRAVCDCGEELVIEVGSTTFEAGLGGLLNVHDDEMAQAVLVTACVA